MFDLSLSVNVADTITKMDYENSNGLYWHVT